MILVESCSFGLNFVIVRDFKRCLDFFFSIFVELCSVFYVGDYFSLIY